MEAPSESNVPPVSDSDSDVPIRRPRRQLDLVAARCTRETQTGNANNVDTGRNKQRNKNVDTSLVAISIECAQRSIDSLEPLLDKELLLITSYLSKKLVTLESSDEVISKLYRALERLGNLESSIRSIDSEVGQYLDQLIARLGVLADGQSIYNRSKDDTDFDKHRKRVSWIAANYLCRKGFTTTAEEHMRHESLEGLVDLDVYIQWDKIRTDLRGRRLGSAIEWARANKTYLEKLDSRFLVNLRVQEAIELIRRYDITGVTAIARSFDKADRDRCDDIGKLFAALVMMQSTKPEVPNVDPGNDSLGAPVDQGKEPRYCCLYCTTATDVCELCGRYADLFSDDRWDNLCQEFDSVSAAVYGLNKRPLLESLVHTGLCAIKTAGCKDQRNSTCPACLPDLQEYVNQIPSTTKLDSVLICPVTGELMDYDNLPFTSPGGCVISDRGLRVLEHTGEEGHIICPRTEDRISREECQKVFVT
ncbi:hypothetical protein BBOV_III003430 [Babesia bovis T2Bo]|uniref:CTLH domain-containing protein n=1 Tax=Babesia bovis TaxID=5865 RepID=A7AMX3_BABBO|nr:hypothetical protein BBOV_III003430 [Babesia bovis T2Bo]EDO07907.1 hypothetical protein BBOV_III003430 [Babesia bovis T2Bo]|eukprot:XP_001611475.1 hypothetical protein [Babesia bovis T2Bo]